MIGAFLNLFKQSFLIWPIAVIKNTWFLWLPFALGYLFWNTWMARVQARFLKNIEWTLLEIKLPREIAKSPKAMETVLTSLHSASAGNWWKRVKEGFLPHWYSLEIGGINGRMHFFVYTPKPFRNLVESQLYAHYPSIEIVESEDYTNAANFSDLREWNLWFAEFGLAKADPYPIRTYVDFGLHDTGVEEEEKTNPLVSFLEFLGSLKQGEQVWFQILIKGSGDDWADEAKKIKDELMGRNKPVSASGESPRPPILSKGEQEVVAAIERNVSKLGFETGIRVAYIARKDIFNKVNTAAINGIMNQYSAKNLNSLKSVKTTSPKPLGFLFKAKREAANKKMMLDAYRQRSYFYAPHKRKSFVFNTEELATVYHFPGRVAETPTFARIEAKKVEPPPTLPI